MADEEKISTVFEFLTKGAKETETTIATLLAMQGKLQAQANDFKGIYNDQSAELDKLNLKFKELAKTLDNGIKKGSVREDFVKTKEAIKDMADTLGDTSKAISSTDKVIAHLSDATGKASLSLKDMKEAQKSLTKELEGAKIGSKNYEEFSKNIALVKNAIQETNAAQKDQIKSLHLAENSVDALRKKYSDLSKEWKNTDRNSPRFKEITKELAGYNEELKKTEAEIGVFNRNVGDYKKAFEGINGAIGQLAPNLSGAVQPLKNMTDGFSKLAATPLLATLTILVSAFNFLKDAFSRSTEAMEKLNIIMGAFDAILGVVSDSIAFFGEVLVKAFTSPLEAWNMLVDGVKNSADIFDEVAEKVKEGMAIAEEENLLKRKTLSETIKIAENERDIALLKSEAYNKEAYTLQKREEMLRSALDLEKENLDVQVERAKKELELFQRRMALSKITFEDEKKEAELKANLIRIEENYYKQTKKLRKELTDFKIQEETAAQQAQQKANDAYLKAIQDQKRAEEDFLKSKISGDQKQIELAQKILNIRTKVFEEAAKKEIKLTEEELLSLEILQLDHQKKMEAIREAETTKKAAIFEKDKQKAIDDYTKAALDLYNLEMKLRESRDAEERRYLKNKIDEVKKNVETQIEALQKLGVAASDIPIQFQQSFNKSQETLVQSLNKSLQTIQEFSGQTAGVFGNLSLSTTGLISSMFDLSKAKEKWGDDLEGMKADVERITMDIAAMAAATSIQLNNGIASIISASFDKQLQETKDYYAQANKIQETSLNLDKKQLEQSLKDQGVSQAKYSIEMFKLQEKQEKQRVDLKRKEANETYEIQTKQFRVKQAQDAIASIIATALGITTAWTNPFTAPFMVPIIAAVGAAQVATIYSQQPPAKPKFKQGGYLAKGGIIEGPSHAVGGVPISVGGQKVAEVEGNEGMLVVSKKAMADPTMRAMFNATHAMNEQISGKNASADNFSQGGYLDFAHFKQIAEGAAHEKYMRDKKKWGIFARKKSNKDIENDARNMFNAYREEQVALLTAQEKAAEKEVNQNISSNEILKSAGISNIQEFYSVSGNLSEKKEKLEADLKLQKEYADAKIELLKQELGYEENLLKFEQERKKAQKELADTTLGLNKKYLDELKASNQITEEDYQSMLDQITKGYGIKTQDIINLKKKEVEEIKKQINAEREAEISAIKETMSFQQKALDQMRAEWKKQYSDFTKEALENLDKAEEYASQLTGTDLERYQQILKINEDIKKLEEDYKKNESIMTDGVIQSREERAAMVAEQKRIKEEIKQKEKEAEEAKKAFEEERKKAEAAALAAYEKENKETILAQIAEQGALLQEQANQWSLDKELAGQLAAELESINAIYDAQIDQQNEIISAMEKEYKEAQLLHDQKLANLKIEEEALKEHFEAQRKSIEDSYKKATENMQKDITSLNAQILAIKVEGAAAGIGQYESTLSQISTDLNNLPKFATGGAIKIGEGAFQTWGPTDKNGGKGVTMSLGGIPLAKLGGGENVLITNEQASKDSRVMRRIEEISAINNSYNNGGNIPEFIGEEIDYELFADKVAQKMNKVIGSRPVNAYIAATEIEKTIKNNYLNKRRSKMI